MARRGCVNIDSRTDNDGRAVQT